MNSYRTEPERRLFDLLDTAALDNASEDDIRLRVVNLIESLLENRYARLETRTQTGSIDILYGNVIIETKTTDQQLGVAPTWARGDEENRRRWAASQLQDYVNERYAGIKSKSTHFIGYTTNGITWHRWEVAVGGETPTLMWSKDLTQPTLDQPSTDTSTLNANIDDLFNDLVTFLRTRPAPPDDLQQILAQLPFKAYEVARGLTGNTDFEIKRSVWTDLMRGAFVITQEDSQRDLYLFATHSVLVDMARKVADNVLGNTDTIDNRDRSAFYSWIYSADAARELASAISREVDRYNWRLARSDILKGIYHEFIPREIRHDFGEYYTPDWLAEAVCEHVIDDQWCQEAVKRSADPNDDLQGLGILEPSCGSGTFLRAAVNRLLPFARQVTNDKVEQANILTRLIHGLDIHPVAVELARANFLAALPAIPSQGHDAINVHISDTLRWMQDTEMRLLGDGILINVPKVGELEQVDVLIPDEVVLHPDFNRIVDDMLNFGDNLKVLEQLLAKFGIDKVNVDTATEAAQILHRLRNEDRNHVWGWYIKNVAEAHRLHHRRFDRIVGNPPWITRKDITQGDPERAERHRSESMKLNLWAGGQVFATQNNLASLFSAVATRDYTDHASDWKVAFVLPWSALRTETWSRFRSGEWSEVGSGTQIGQPIDMSEPPWDLQAVEQRPFPQSDACVIFASNSPSGSKSKPMPETRQRWLAYGVTTESQWGDIKPAIRRETSKLETSQATEYLENADNGATLFPISLIRIDPTTIEQGGMGRKRFLMSRSRHGIWSQINLPMRIIEDQCIRNVAYADDLAPFRIISQSFACLPPNDAFLSDDPIAAITDYRYFTKHWYEADALWRKHHGQTPPATLLDRVNHQNKLANQLKSAKNYRVAYPGSGRWMFGVAIPPDIVVNHGCIYVELETQEEANYLASVFTADALQNAYLTSQVTDRHFDLNPLRSIPIPTYNPKDPTHSRLATLGNRATEVAAQVPPSGGIATMRDAIRDALRQDGVMAEINRNYIPD